MILNDLNDYEYKMYKRMAAIEERLDANDAAKDNVLECIERCMACLKPLIITDDGVVIAAPKEN